MWHVLGPSCNKHKLNEDGNIDDDDDDGGDDDGDDVDDGDDGDDNGGEGRGRLTMVSRSGVVTSIRF